MFISTWNNLFAEPDIFYILIYLYVVVIYLFGGLQVFVYIHT